MHNNKINPPLRNRDNALVVEIFKNQEVSKMFSW